MTPPARRPEWHVLYGWGESACGWSRVHVPRSVDELADLLTAAARDGRRICVRGAGRSYGDAALHDRREVVDLRELSRILSFDPRGGRIEAQCGAPIESLWRECVGHGWWPAVVPGTMHPTVGGCLAMNVHGKNQYRVGLFGEHAEEIEVLFPDGRLVRLRPDRDRELFHAVVGGAGLLGVIVSATLGLKRVHSGELMVTAFATPTLEEMIASFEERAEQADYLVGWVDCFHPRGRGVVHEARHLSRGTDPAPAESLSPQGQELPASILGLLPRDAVAPLMRPLANDAGIRLVNAAKYRAARIDGTHTFVQSHGAFAFLLDYVPGWKRVYDPGGLIQYQSFVPREHAARVHLELLALCRLRGIVPWLGVYKKHRPDPFLLSYGVDGYSFAMDFRVTDAGRENLWALCREMDEIVLAAGGRFYFAKDLTATARSAERAFPGLARFRELKRELDPAGVLTSDLAQRLALVDVAR